MVNLKRMGRQLFPSKPVPTIDLDPTEIDLTEEAAPVAVKASGVFKVPKSKIIAMGWKIRGAQRNVFLILTNRQGVRRVKWKTNSRRTENK